jgi:quinol monooxygenase YgiN
VEAFKAVVIEEMDDPARLEPGVHVIHAAAYESDRAKFMFFEIYANRQARDAHRNTPHFCKFLDAAKGMARGRRIIETNAVPLIAQS